MNAAVMDTLEAARGLKAAGVEHGQAEAIVKMVAVAAVAGHEDLTTKADFAELKAEFAAAVNRMLLGQIAVAGALLAAMALLLAVLKFF